jgi:hypothetical protein
MLGRESELGPGGSGVLVLRLSVFWIFGISSFASEQVLAWNDPLAGKRMLTWWYRRFPYGKIAVLPLRGLLTGKSLSLAGLFMLV